MPRVSPWNTPTHTGRGNLEAEDSRREQVIVTNSMKRSSRRERRCIFIETVLRTILVEWDGGQAAACNDLENEL
jgi:hypothetical protein